MHSYINSLKYAQYVLQLRDGLISGDIIDSEHLYAKNIIDNSNNTIMGKSFFTRFGQRPYMLGHLKYNNQSKMGTTIATKQYIDFYQNHYSGVITSDGLCSFDLNTNYDEARYFQDSLLYSDTQLHLMVIANLLYAHPMTEYSNFKLYFRSVITLLKLLGKHN